MSKPGEETGHAYVSADGNHELAHSLFCPGHHAVGFMFSQAGGTREEISIFCLSFSLLPTNIPGV
jgi:hypothetical protein